MDTRSDKYGQSVMLTPKKSRKIKFDPQILSLVEHIERIKPSEFESTVLIKNERRSIIESIDIERLYTSKDRGKGKGKSQYSKTELSRFAKNLGIEQIQKLSKDDLTEKIRAIILENQEML